MGNIISRKTESRRVNLVTYIAVNMMNHVTADCFRACLKNHSRNLHASLCGIFRLNSIAVAPATAPSSGQNLPQIVTHILQKAFLNML